MEMKFLKAITVHLASEDDRWVVTLKEKFGARPGRLLVRQVGEIGESSAEVLARALEAVKMRIMAEGGK